MGIVDVPKTRGRSKTSVEDRFWSKVQVLNPASCWTWQGGFQTSGYGQFWFRGKCWTAPRAAYTLTKGEISDGMCVCHRCDNKKCCNPNHLFIGTPKDNMVDKTRKGRHGKAKLTVDDVRTIRDRIKTGDTQVQIAKDYNVSPATISLLKRRITWDCL